MLLHGPSYCMRPTGALVTDRVHHAVDKQKEEVVVMLIDLQR